MLVSKFILIFFLLISFAYCEVNAEKPTLRKIAYIQNNIFATKKESRIAEKLWNKEMKDYNVSILLINIKTEKEALKLCERTEIHSIIDDGTFYYKYKEKLDFLSKKKWILSSNEKMFTQYYLIKNHESTFDYNNLSKDKIYYKEGMAKVWFEYLLLKKNIKTNNIINRMKQVKKDKNLIFNSFFNKNSISIISKDLYDPMYALNPQIGEKIDIVEKSKTIFFNAIGVTVKTLNTGVDIMKTFIEKDENELETFSFAKIQKIYPIKKDELKQTDKFFQEYYALKKKNKN